ADGYLPVLVVRHRITDSGAGALTSPPFPPEPKQAAPDPVRRPRSQPVDQLRLAHARRMLLACGYAAECPLAGVIGLDADVVLWHDLDAPTWPGGRSTLEEYDVRFADRLAVATAAASGAEPLAQPSRVVECRHCPWWPTCEAALLEVSDVSLVLRGEDGVSLRAAGVRTVRDLATLDPAAEPPVQLVGLHFPDAVAMARAWLADLTVVRKVPELRVPRANVELDVDMESFSDSGAYLWGCLLSGVDIGVRPGYHGFVTWNPLPTADEGRSFGEFWEWLSGVRLRAAARGLSFRAYCYNELAENRWLLASADRFAGAPGVPDRTQVRAFIGSPAWVDLYRSVSNQLLCARGKGLKVIAPVAGFHWRDPDAGGENSMRWYRDAVGLDGRAPDVSQRDRLLRYNEDDVRATHALREWMTSSATDLPYIGDL
ncbi:MAG: TM0106 family RecB-like putative nuclease, partial [Sciscionella sp.]